MSKKSETGSDSESYRYFMDAAFHGDASADSLWGGEVNAQLNVEGGSDDVRNRFSNSTFDSIGKQVTHSTHEVDYKYVDQQSADQMTTSFYSKRKVTFDNSRSDTSLTTQVYEALEPYCTLLTLKNIEICYFDGVDQNILSMDRFPIMAPNWFNDPDEAARIVNYVASELQRIADVNGRAVSFLDPSDPSSLRINRGLRSVYEIEEAPGESVATRGVIKSAQETKQPTYGVIPIDIHGA